MIPLTGAQAPTGEQEAARRYPPGGVLIVGAGIAGCCLAYETARRGVPTTLIESGEIGRSGASAVGVALLNPYRGRRARPGPLDVEGLAAFWRLDAMLDSAGHPAGAHRSGVLRIATDERQSRAWAQLPELLPVSAPAPYRAPHGAYLIGDGGWVEPRRLLRSLRSAAEQVGCRIREHSPVHRLERNEHGWTAHLTSGSLDAQKVILCVGAGSVAGIQLPELERIAGDQVTLAFDGSLPYPLAGSVYLASLGDRVLVGGNHRSPDARDPAAGELLRSSAARMVPPLAGAPIIDMWTGVRARGHDNVPILRELEPSLWFMGAFGGRGFLTAPLLAARLATHLSGRG